MLQAWRALGGFCDSSGALTYDGGQNSHAPVSGITCKLAFLRLLELNTVVPHCVEKFRASFGNLYWTAERLYSFGYDFPTACFCNDPLESAEHLFFHCPLAKSGIDWIQSQLFLAATLAPSLCVRHLLFGFNSDELVVVPRVFVYLLLVLKHCIWTERNDFRFRSSRPSVIGLLASIKARARFYLPLFF